MSNLDSLKLSKLPAFCEFYSLKVCSLKAVSIGYFTYIVKYCTLYNCTLYYDKAMIKQQAIEANNVVFFIAVFYVQNGQD